jgi:outer membrane protein OmpA-like peptidoglycan-associated protein
MKRFARIIGCAAMAFSAPAAAQIEPDVTVNPQASGSQVLLYPDGKHGRVVRTLLQPGEGDPNGVVWLHMPGRHPVRHRTVARKTPPKPKIQVAKVAPRPAPQEAPPPEAATAFSSLPSESAARLLGDDTTAAAPAARPPAVKPPKPQPIKQATAAPPKSAPKAMPKPSAPPVATARAEPTSPPPAPPPERVASAEPAPESMKDVTGRSSVAFPPGGEEPVQAAVDTVRVLAGSLNSSLWSSSARIQLDAFGGGRGDKSSEARRLSLKRALIVRQLLIDDGVPSERIEVHALGGADSGSSDRVDIYVKG